MSVQAPEWYRRGIGLGIARLASLQLGKTPAPEDLAGLVETWIEATWAAPARRKLPDLPAGAGETMMAVGFTLLAAQIRWWPAPEQWIEALDAVAVPGQRQLMAPERLPPLTFKERQRFAERLRALRETNHATA